MTGRAQQPLPGTQPLDAKRRTVRCRLCHRELTDGESRLYQLGPDCRDHIVPTPRRQDVEQDTLPGLV